MKMPLFFKALLVALIFIATQQTSASTFQVDSQTGTGLGRAYAGEAVIADNASVMSRNAAAMALFYRQKISLGWTSATATLHDGISNSTSSTATANNPNLYFIMPVTDNFSLGFDSYTNESANTNLVGLVNKIPKNSTDSYSYITTLNTLNVGLASSYRINMHWSLGAGLDVAYSDGILTNKTSTSPSTITPYDFNGVGLGFNLGTVVSINRHHRYGLSYHYSPKITTTVATTNLAIPLPDNVEFSGYDKIPATLFALTYSVQWVRWSAFKAETQNGTLPWKDNINGSLGWMYYINTTWIVRAAYRYDWAKKTDASALASTLITPNARHHWFATGFTYQINPIAKIDFGLAFLLGQTISPKPGDLSTIQTNALLVGLQYSRGF